MGLIHKDAVIVKVTVVAAQWIAGTVSAPFHIEGCMRRSVLSDMMTIDDYPEAEPNGWLVLLDGSLDKSVAIVRRKHIVAVEIE